MSFMVRVALNVMLAVILLTAIAMPSEADDVGRMGIVLQRRRLFWIAERPAIQRVELDLSAVDAEKIKTLCDEVRASVRETLGDPPNLETMSGEERKKAIEAIEQGDLAVTEKFKPRLKEILTADQLTRLKQINWQQAYVLDDAEVAETLSLSQDQKDRLQAIVAEHQARMDKQYHAVDIDTMRGTIIPVGTSPEERRKLFEQFQAKINDVLTQEQQEKLAELKGKDFNFQLLYQPEDAKGISPITD